jgi:hypothetical protein
LKETKVNLNKVGTHDEKSRKRWWGKKSSKWNEQENPHNIFPPLGQGKWPRMPGQASRICLSFFFHRKSLVRWWWTPLLVAVLLLVWCCECQKDQISQ